MGMNKTEFCEKMLEKKILLIQGKVDGDMVCYIRESVAQLICQGSPDVFVAICSGGGSVTAGLDIYDILGLYSGKKTALVFNYARSMAAVILQACEERMATTHSKIMIHHISTNDISLDTLRSEDKLNERKKAMERDQDYLYRILSDRTGKSITDITNECFKDRDMNVDEAKAFGLIDKIWTKHFPWDVK
jgi:ATP-dependent Clp protease protease subunit